MNLQLLDKEKLASNGIEVKNIVAKLDLDIELDLSYLDTQFPHSSYEPEQYPSLIFRPEALPTMLITNSGIILFTGGDSIESVYEAYHKVTREFKNIDLDVSGKDDEIQIQNIVSTFEVDHELDLNHISIKLGLEQTEYEPEQFPGVTYRIENGPVALLFSSGKIVITGGKSSDDILSAVETVRGLILE
jgi:transcription initiation factor TFIID TATA-box-binding protein